MTRWIAHRGNASHRPGGTPTRQTLQTAIADGADLIEIDVHTTADGVLVVRHDSRFGQRRTIPTLTYAELLRADPSVMRVDEVDAFVAGRVRLLLDIKGENTAEGLARLLSRHPDQARFAVCSSRLQDFEAFQTLAPAVARWPSFPDIDANTTTAIRRVVAALGHRRERGEVTQMLRDAIRAGRDLVRDRNAALENLGGMPWRDGLPAELAEVAAATGASGISVHQWLVTPALVQAAHELGLTVTAWTVNRPDALAAVVRAGVDFVTSDDVPAMRRILPGLRINPPGGTTRFRFPPPPEGLPGREVA